MSLRPLNRDPKYMSGEYKEMFKIPSHDSNKRFVSNPYNPSNGSDKTCFSLTEGARPCKPDNTKILVWNAVGDVIRVPARLDLSKK